MVKRYRAPEFQLLDLDVVRLQIKKARHPKLWTAYAEKELQKKIEKRAYYQTSLFSLDCDGFILRDLVTAISTMFFVFAVSFAIVCFIVP